MLRKKIMFYMFCITLFTMSIFLFEIRYYVAIISGIIICISLFIAISKTGVHPIKNLFIDLKNNAKLFLTKNRKNNT